MCISPVSVPNLNRGATAPLIRRYADTQSARIYVPCNVCSECVMSRQQQIVQRCQTMCLDHHAFYITLTYNSQSLPVYALSNGHSIPYADISDVQKMFKRIRKSNSLQRPFSYLAVSERGTKRGRPHFHIIVFVRKLASDTALTPINLQYRYWKIFLHEWRRNYGSTRNPDYRPLCTYQRKFVAGREYTNYDCHYVDPGTSKNGQADVAFYVTKYMLKPSTREKRLRIALYKNLPEDDYEECWKIVRSKMLISKHFGASTDLEKEYILSQIKSSVMNPTGFKYTTDRGSFPLARYYRQFIPAHDYVMNVDISGGPMAYFQRRQKSPDDIDRSIHQLEHIQSLLDLKDFSLFL